MNDIDSPNKVIESIGKADYNCFRFLVTYPNPLDEAVVVFLKSHYKKLRRLFQTWDVLCENHLILYTL